MHAITIILSLYIHSDTDVEPAASGRIYSASNGPKTDKSGLSPVIPGIPASYAAYRLCRYASYLDCHFGKLCARNNPTNSGASNDERLRKVSKKVDCPATITMKECFLYSSREDAVAHENGVRCVYVRIPRRRYHRNHDTSVLCPTQNRLSSSLSKTIQQYTGRGVTGALNMTAIVDSLDKPHAILEDRSLYPSTRQISNAIQRAKLKLRRGDSDQEETSLLVCQTYS